MLNCEVELFWILNFELVGWFEGLVHWGFFFYPLWLGRTCVVWFECAFGHSLRGHEDFVRSSIFLRTYFRGLRRQRAYDAWLRSRASSVLDNMGWRVINKTFVRVPAHIWQAGLHQWLSGWNLLCLERKFCFGKVCPKWGEAGWNRFCCSVRISLLRFGLFIELLRKLWITKIPLMKKIYTFRFALLITVFVTTIIVCTVACSSAIARSVNNNPQLLFSNNVMK